MRRVSIATVVLLAVGALAVGWYKAIKAGPKAKLLDRFCLATRLGIEQDRSSFLSGDGRRQEEAYSRFYAGQAVYHGVSSLEYCIPEDEIPTVPDHCLLAKDWKCLARSADDILAKLP